MQITGTSSLTHLRQPSQMSGGQQDQRLVFLYPMMFDSNLRQYQDMLRDFLTVDFMGQVKISNALQVTTKATQVGVIGTGTTAINPAQEVRRSMHYSLYDPSQQNQPTQDNNSPHAYQERIHSFLSFIRNQIQYDPRYQNLRPLISTLTVQENLITIPLIMGTKAYTCQASALYWILLVSTAYNWPLTEANLTNIERIIMSMPDDKFMELLFTQAGRDRVLANSNIVGDNRPYVPSSTENRLRSIGGADAQHPATQRANSISERRARQDPAILKRVGRSIQNEVEKSLRDFRTILSYNRWVAETSHISRETDTISLENLPIIQTRTQRAHFMKAMASFNSYFSNFIIPILHNLEFVTGPTPTNINFQEKVENFEFNANHSLTQVFTDLATLVANQIGGTINGVATGQNIATGADNPVENTMYQPSSTERFRNARERVNHIMASCEANVELTSEIKKLLINDLEPNLRMAVSFNAVDIINFGKSVSQASSRLTHHGETIHEWIKNMLTDTAQYDASIRIIRGQISQAVDIFLYGGQDANDRAAAILLDGHIDIIDFRARYRNFITRVCGPDPNTATDVCMRQFVQYIRVIEIALNNLIEFFFIWNFLSYLCSYIREVDIDIEIQRKEVLDFPNYCLAVPLDIFKLLYALQASANFQRLLHTSSPTTDAQLRDIDQRSLIVNTDDVKHLISFINGRLKVPNLIVIDKKRNEVYYQFMYMSRANKISMSAMENYTKHQVDTLPGF